MKSETSNVMKAYITYTQLCSLMKNSTSSLSVAPLLASFPNNRACAHARSHSLTLSLNLSLTLSLPPSLHSLSG